MPSRKKTASATPATARMLDLIVGYWVSQLIHVAARLSLADLMKDKPRSLEALAKETGVDEGRLYRVLRALASLGIFTERKDGRFAMTPLAATLRGDRPDSMRDFALMMAEGYNWGPWSKLSESLRSGGTPFNDFHGMKIFEYLARHPEDAAVFGRSMTSISGTENPAVEAAYDFSRMKILVDVGGSHGHLLAAILAKNPKLRGVLFDQAHVVEQARHSPYVNGRGVKSRIELRPGDFFTSVPDGADAYIMKYILHDWDDDSCVRILKNCRAGLAAGGRVLVVDTVIPPGNGRNWGKLLDINMMILTGGRERTKAEFGRIFAEAGLKLARVIPTASRLSIVEGVRAA